MSVRRDKTPWIIVTVLSGIIVCILIGIAGALASWWWNQSQTKVRGTLTPASVASPALPTPSALTLLPLPPITQQFDQWQMWLQGGSRVAGNNLAQIVGDAKYKQVAQFKRTNGQGDSGGAGLVLPVDLNVAAYPHLYVRLIGKIDQEMGANIANTNPKINPEGAIQIRIQYQTASAQAREWYHGFYTSAILRADEEHFTQVFDGEWFNYFSPDLKTLPESPQSIKEIRVYGYGWEFQSQVAEMSLLGSTAR